VTSAVLWEPVAAVLLSPAQTRAITLVRDIAVRDTVPATDRAAGLLVDADIRLGVAELCERIAEVGRVALNFHPDRIAAGGRTVVEALLEDGIYRNQFETGISNGGFGAIRDRFEERLFAGAYQDAGVVASDRPKYGGLDLVGHLDGPCPRYGSCHLRLRRGVLFRSTFSFGDSVTSPTAVGTIEAFVPVLAALLAAAEAGGHSSVVASCNTVLGLTDPTVASLVDRLVGTSQTPPAPGRALDDYIEAQIHGPVRLHRDVEGLVADPSFRGTQVGSQLDALAQRHHLELRWNDGFELAATDVPAEFRGPAIPRLAERVAAEFGDGSGRLNAEIIGRAAQSVVTEPNRWVAWGDAAEALQQIKRLWHVLVNFGAPSGKPA
jgi:hypothetical protein